MTDPPRQSAAPREVELKLEVAEGDLQRLVRHPLLRRLGRGRAVTRTVRSVYYDTPELDLHARGISLRLRDEAHGRRQTVKMAVEAAGGLFDRDELEAHVPGTEPDLAAVADPALRALLVAETVGRGQGLFPTVETDVHRTTRRLVAGDTELELALDVGEVRTRAGALPIRELELELVRGEPGPLFDVALELQSTLDLVPADRDKAERGFAQLTGALAAPRRAGAPELAGDATVDDVLAAVLGDALAQITRNAAPARAGLDPEGVHQLRVGVRRARSALALFQKGALLPVETTRALREELRWLGTSLGPARDLDVLLGELLEPLVRARPDDGALKRVRDEAVSARAEAYDQVREALDGRRFPRLVLQLARLTTARGWREQPLSPASARLFAPAREVGAKLLAHRHARALAAGGDLESRTAAELHALRIRLKKLRYASEFLGGLFPRKRARRFTRRVATLQDVLGHLNDGAVAATLLATIVGRLGDEAGADHHRAAGFAAGFAAGTGQAGRARLAKRWRRFESGEAFWE